MKIIFTTNINESHFSNDPDMLRTLDAIVESCTARKEIEPGGTIEEEKISNVNQMSSLGKQLQNPYSVVNMQKAYDNLSQSNARLNEKGVKVKTTHLYIKFKPKNESELEILKDDSTLVLYSYPLDYEISPGTYYRDPNVPQGRPTYQYCAVPVEKQLPVGVAHEILEGFISRMNTRAVLHRMLGWALRRA